MSAHGNAAVSYGNAWLQTFPQSIPWIWEGVVAEDAVRLLSAPEKAGKTTLLSLLLDRRRVGGQLLAFRARLRDDLRSVQDTLQDRDAPPLREAAHRLSGMVSTFSTAAGPVASDRAAERVRTLHRPRPC
jgi:hypothetical protein